MYFKGTIVITDPCYLFNPCLKPLSAMSHPLHESYFDFEDFESFSLSRCEDILNKSQKLGISTAMNSKHYEISFNSLLDSEFTAKRLYKTDFERLTMGTPYTEFGLSSFMRSPTYCGDWFCNVYNSASGNKLGSFCSDSSNVSVFYLHEALKYNPDFSLFISQNPDCSTIIPDFDGEVCFLVTQTPCDCSKTSCRSPRKSVEIRGLGPLGFFTR